MLTYELDTLGGLVVCRAQGRFGVLDVSDYIQTLAADPKFDPRFNALILVTEVAAIPPFPMLRFLHPLLDAWTARRGTAKWAFVLPNQAARAMAETALNHLSLNEVQARCFLTERDAREWLSANRPVLEDASLTTSTMA
jgi:hypothetical protein